jgi:hypothetical protein
VLHLCSHKLNLKKIKKMTTRSIINLSLSKLSFTNLAGFAQTIHDGFVAQIAVYATPNPLMAAFLLDIKALNTAITAWGVKGNRGSHADHVALRNAADVVKNDLRMLADYAQNTEPDNTTSWTAVGFKVKRAKSKPVALEMVQNLRNFISRDIPAPAIKLKWKKPLGADESDVKGYVVQRNNVPEQPSIDGSRAIANVIGIVTNTSFIDGIPFVGANYYWVTPFNTLGYGVSSDPLMVISTKLKP